MRKLIYGINLSLDGCCDHSKLSAGEDIHDYFTQLMQQAGLLLYGRITYELMVPFWPEMARNQSGPTKALNDFAQAFDAVPKLVFSNSLDRVEDPHSSIARTNLRDEVFRLKQQPGKDIMTGGVALPAQLLELGLVDEFIVVIHPFVVGAGRRLFADTPLQENLALTLVETQTLPSGCVALRHQKRDKPTV